MITVHSGKDYSTRIQAVETRSKKHPTWCETCGEDVRMITAEKAANLIHCSRRKVYRWIEEGDLHFVELPEGEVLVCGRALALKLEELDSSTGKLKTGCETLRDLGTNKLQ